MQDTWVERFEGITISNLVGGEAMLLGHLPDQAALQRILKRISSLGLTLISINAVTGED